ncbi:MAG: hypothetical protein A3G20_09430 [Acidobacteria bacterium RIFCSPLOWO2_12_FULL_59_11]|nr:MAG: hypothetical protein A3G20_09430 [Acidobacteria bacterium RIFCSPLOWO2_12_FULL_59_11]
MFCAPVLTDYRIADDFRLVGQFDFPAALRYFYQAPGIGRNERPVVRFTFAGDNFVWEDRAFGCHLTNVLLHTANSVLLLLSLERLTGNLALAFLSAALFAFHPVTHERVAWIAARDGAGGL